MDGPVSDLMVNESTFVYGGNSTSSTTEELLLQGVSLTQLLFTPLTTSLTPTTTTAATTTLLLANASRGAVSNEAHINSFFAKFPPTPYSVHLTFGFIMAMVGIIAVVGNLFIVYVFYRFRSLRTPGNVFVSNLALADGMMALTGFPFYTISSFKGRWIFGGQVCSLYGMFGAAFGLMSINTLAAIAFERYLVIVKCYPAGRKSSRRHVAMLLVIVWVNSFSWALAPVLGWNRYSLEGFGTTCSFDYTTRSPAYRSLVLSMFFAGFILPLALIIYCYIYIIAYVHDSERDLADTTSSVDSHMWQGARQLYRRTELRIARTVILTVVFFCLSWLPYSAVALIGQFGDQSLITPWTSAIPGVMAKMSTMYNPFIYSFSHPRIKKKVWLFIQTFLPDAAGSMIGQTDVTPKDQRLSVFKMAIDKRVPQGSMDPSTVPNSSRVSSQNSRSRSSQGSIASSQRGQLHEPSRKATVETGYILKHESHSPTSSHTHSGSSSSRDNKPSNSSTSGSSSNRSFDTCPSEPNPQNGCQDVWKGTRTVSSRQEDASVHTMVNMTSTAMERQTSLSGGSLNTSEVDAV